MPALLDNIARFLRRIGLSADGATLIALVLTASGGVLIGRGYFLVGGFVAGFGGLFDLLDGRIARISGEVTKAGAILDSTLDRYADAFLYGGFICWFARADEPLYAALAFSACVGAFATSYVRARSEGLGQPCQVGFWERAERFFLILIALGFGNLHLAIIYLGVLTHLTALERLMYARAKMRLSGGAGGWAANPFVRTWILQEGGRITRSYWVKAAFFAATAAGIRF